MRARLVRMLIGSALGLFSGGLVAPTAFANGVFPAAGQIVLDPSDSTHIVVRTTFGLLTTRAGGEPWDWICEPAVGYGDMFNPAVAVTEDGTVIAGVPDGLAVAGGNTCAWAMAEGPIDGSYVVDASTEREEPARAVAITSNGASGTARFWESLDNGGTWTQAGVDLPAGFVPLSVDVAPSDTSRVYVSGLTGGGGGGISKGSLAVSADRGQSWALYSVPGSKGDTAPFIGAIAPADPDRVYVRLDGAPGRLLTFDHAVLKFTEVFAGAGFLYGFALSPDGQTVLVGGSTDGIWRAPVATLTFEKVSELATKCLTWREAGVYSCATELAAGFTVGLSEDEGATFQPVLHLPCVRGPLECSAGTPPGDLCPALWPAVAVQIGQAECVPSAAGGAGGTGAATTTGTSTGGAGGNGNGNGNGNGGGPSGGAAGAGGGSAGAAGNGGGCGCSLPAAPGGAVGIAVLIGAVLLGARRARAKPIVDRSPAMVTRRGRRAG